MLLILLSLSLSLQWIQFKLECLLKVGFCLLPFIYQIPVALFVLPGKLSDGHCHCGGQGNGWRFNDLSTSARKWSIITQEDRPRMDTLFSNENFQSNVKRMPRKQEIQFAYTNNYDIITECSQLKWRVMCKAIKRRHNCVTWTRVVVK